MMNKFGEELESFLEFSNISIKEFAERIDTTPKNLIDIIKGNIELTQNMIYNISFVTDIPVSYIENVEKNYKLDKKINNYIEKNNITIRSYINKFNYKELSKKYDIKYTDCRNDYSIAKDIFRYLRITNPEKIYEENNSIFYKSKNDKPELLALWLERCYRLSREQNIKAYNKDNITILVDYIRDCAKRNIFDESKLINKFNDNGIYLVIEDDLPGSKIRGAFKVLNDKPAIYITRKHKRYADIYFALLHELAHCKSDFNRAKSGSIVSNFNDEVKEDYELKADKTAFNWMINDKDYELVKNNIKLLESNNYINSFVVYRLAHDNIIEYNSSTYQKYNNLIKEEG